MGFIPSSSLRQISFIFIFSLALAGKAQENEKTFFQKAKPDLLAAFKNGQNEFWIVLNEQADVSGSQLLATKEEKGEYVFKKLTETASLTQAALLPLLKNKANSYQSFWIVNAIYVSGNMELAKEIAAFKEVKELLPNPIIRMLKPMNILPDEVAKQDASRVAIEWGIDKTNAPKVWALGYKGQGVVVGGEDTGYQFDHPAIKSQYRGFTGSGTDHNYNWHDAIHSGTGSSCGINSLYPCDDVGHGTHTMGTMVGDDQLGNQVGMAPSAKWIGCRNMNAGAGTPVTYIECFQWFLAPTDLNNKNPMPSKAPHVINNSWGCDASEGCMPSNFSTMETAVKNLRAAGVMVVVSAGNDGPNCNTVSTPAAIFDESFSVGATTSTDAMAGFSSRGNVTIDNSNRIKPDISAPGSGIRSSYPGGGYTSMSGTSMAGPHVAGAVALLISAVPGLAGKIDSIERILEKTAVHITSTQTCNGTSPTMFPNNTVGYGRIDILAAVNYALSVSVSTPTYNQPGKGITVFPTPAIDKLFARFENSKEEQAEITLFNTTGQALIEKTTVIHNNALEIPVGALSKGFYIYSIRTAGTTYYGKFIKD